MSDGARKILIIFGVVCAVIAGALLYDGTCDDAFFSAFHSVCHGPK